MKSREAEDALNLDARSSDELQRVVVPDEAVDDPNASYVIPEALVRAVRATIHSREFLNQPFGETT
jgi:hypothetical protein